MTTSRSPQSASRAAQRKHLENARFAISLGAAFAILCAVVFDTPESQAANGGLLELLFGRSGGGYYAVQQAPTLSYGGERSYGSYSRRRSTRRGRTQYARYSHSHRHVADRRAGDGRTERHHIVVRRVRDRSEVVLNTLPPTRDIASVTQKDRGAPVERKNAAPVTTVAFTQVAAVSPPVSASFNAVCVRACDGFSFPIAAKSSASAAQESCDRLCPGSETKAFLMPGGATKIDDAVAVSGGETYAQFVARISPDSAKAKSCACPQTAENLSDTSAFLSDLTLRPGDTVVTAQGVRIVRPGSHYPFKRTDFLSLAETRALPRATRGALFAIDRAIKTPYGRLAVASNSERRRHRMNADL